MSHALNPKVQFSIGYDEQRSQSIEISLKDLILTETFSVENLLGRLGVDVNKIRKSTFTCPTQNVPQCFAATEKYLGKAVPFVGSDRSAALITTNVGGAISYDWVDQKGEKHSTTSPFSNDVPLFTLDLQMSMQECGSVEPIKREAEPVLTLRANSDKYIVPVPISVMQQTLKGTLKLNLAIRAPMSSTHIFRLVAQTQDGRKYKSRQVNLDYFLPNKK